jgi:hypothetical protein
MLLCLSRAAGGAATLLFLVVFCVFGRQQDTAVWLHVHHWQLQIQLSCLVSTAGRSRCLRRSVRYSNSSADLGAIGRVSCAAKTVYMQPCSSLLLLMLSFWLQEKEAPDS